MPTFADILQQNPRGWGPQGPALPGSDFAPPMGGPTEDIERLREVLGPVADFVVAQTAQRGGGSGLDMARRAVEGDLTAEKARDVALTTATGPLFGIAGRAAAAHPRLATMLLAGGTPAVAGEPSDKESVMQLQRTLRDAGYYSGPIDGVMGGGTKEANEAYQRNQIERMRLEAETAKAASATKETDRLSSEAEAAREKREKGMSRLQEVEDEVPWYRQMLREYGPTMGYVLGITGGGATRKGVSKLSDAMSQRRATYADELLKGTPSDVPERVGRVNQFWAEGQRPFMGSPRAPFVSAPGTRHGFRANRDAPQASELYQPSRAKNAATDVGIGGTFLAESIATQELLEPQAQEELRAAQEAVNADPSEVNIQRLQTAKDNLALVQTVRNFGRTGAAGYLGGGLKYGRNPVRPNVAAAESERIRMDQILKQGGATPRAPTPSVPPSPTVITRSTAGTYHGPDGRFVSPPKKPRK